MSNLQTAEQVKEKHIELLGEELGPLYHALWNEIAWLYSKWNDYLVLFGTKPSRIELLNKAASSFFRTVQDTFWDVTLLHLARLTDPPKSVGKPNLTIQRLPLHVDDKEVVEKLKQCIEIAKETTMFCRDRRNRRIAHRDLALALNEETEPLLPASREKVKEALKAITSTMNVVSIHYMSSTTFFEDCKAMHGAANLLYVLDDGLKAEEERNIRIKNREYKEGDFGPRDL